MARGNVFTTVRSEGALLPADFLQKLVEPKSTVEGLQAADYHLAGSEKPTEAASRAWNHLLGVWASFQTASADLKPGERATTLTREKWLLPLFQELGYGRLQTARAFEIEGKGYAISHIWQQTPIHLVGRDVDLDRRTPGVAGAARTSPHGLLQEFLNRSEGHLWGFVSNGLRLRVLHDNRTFTRQAYVDFDLAAMMEGQVFADFVLLWLVCHQSRVEGERSDQCWLEKWSEASKKGGTRALDDLRDGVQRAIETLGRGFLRHTANAALKQSLATGGLDKQEYYRELLREVYRLIFLFVAEDRDLLLIPDASPAAKGRYAKFYSAARLRTLAERRRGTQHDDLWRGLSLVFQRLSSVIGCSELGLPALGSFLWSEKGTPDLDPCAIANTDLLEAVRALAFTTDRGIRRAVDYRNLGPEELGSVYESLLELHPDLNADAGTFELKTAAGHERKTTGSYYTPTSLIECLLDSALDPVLDDAGKKSDPATAILKLKVCDPACGSGHFLIAAAHRIANRLASVRTGDEEPSPAAVRNALREVVSHCIYGVDANPMAVELCKVNLWLEALEPGKPLSFLDHHIQCGDSLLGTTPALLANGIPDEAFDPIEGDEKDLCKELKKRNKRERDGFRSLPFEHPWDRLGDLALGMAQLDALGDDTPDALREKEQRWGEYLLSTGYDFSRLWADAWCAAFMWRNTSDQAATPITEDVFRTIERNPNAVPRSVRDAVRRIATEYRFFHWHLMFPGVFRVSTPVDELTGGSPGWLGGFDCVVGNPPWEVIKIESDLKSDVRNRRRVEALQKFLKVSGRFPLGRHGKTNTMPLFTELYLQLTSIPGYAGIIVKSVIATERDYRPLFEHVVRSGVLQQLIDVENAKPYFVAVHRQERFSLLTFRKPPLAKTARYALCVRDIEEIRQPDRFLTLSEADLRALSAGVCALPSATTAQEFELLNKISKRCAGSTVFSDGWSARFFKMMDTSQVATDPRTVTLPAYQLQEEHDEPHCRVYEGKTFDAFDHRYATYVVKNGAAVLQQTAEHLKQSHEFEAQPAWWVPKSLVDQKLAKYKWRREWLLIYSRKVNRNNVRTASACIVPLAAAVDTCPVLLFSDEPSALRALLVTCVINSLPFDYVVRQRLVGFTLGRNQLALVPLPPVSVFQSAQGGITELVIRAGLELTYTSVALEAFARDCGYTGRPFVWESNRRWLLQREIDAAMCHMYGLSRKDVESMLGTFRVLKQSEEKQFGEFRSKRVVLDLYERMQCAMEVGDQYRTSMDPPPASGFEGRAPYLVGAPVA